MGTSDAPDRQAGLRARLAAAGRARASTVRFEGSDHPYVEIVVEDDGPGVPESILERIFEPNFSTKSGGTGLGLAICRQIVESLRGEIHVESGSEGGAVFRVHLPAAVDEDSSGAEPDA